jgi:hypothetical protein
MSYIEQKIGPERLVGEVMTDVRGLKFSQGTNILIRGRVKDFTEDEQEAFGGYVIIWAAMKAYCVWKGTVTDFTFEDVCDWVDKMTSEDRLKIINYYMEANNFSVPTDEPPSEVSEEEKKSISEIIEPSATE